MKWRGLGVFAFILSVLIGYPAAAVIDTIPTSPSLTTGPLVITGYSFSGPSLRYIQIYNNSSGLVRLEGWQISSVTKSTPANTTVYMSLEGALAPGNHIVAAIPEIVDESSFTLPDVQPVNAPLVGNVLLQPPVGSGFNEEMVTVPTITSGTVKEVVEGATNYYLKRDISASTGKYLSGFTFTTSPSQLANDGLYVYPASARLQITEIYPDSPVCSPLSREALCNDYVKIYNAAASDIDLSWFRVRTGAYGQSATSSTTQPLIGVLSSKAYAIVPLTLSSSGNWVWIEDIYGIVQYEETLVQYPNSSEHDEQAWAYNELTGEWQWTTTPVPLNAPSSFPELEKINDCPGIKLSELAANVATEDQFIEVQNKSDESVDISGCILQTNRSSSARYTFPSRLLAPSDYITIYIKETDLTLTKTTSGTVYLLSSDGKTELDVSEYSNLGVDTAWAKVDDQWVQTFTPTPSQSNFFLQFPPCETGYERNIQSGYCNKILPSSDPTADCGAGKYRSPDTNRCRSLDALAAALTPCDSGQYRNPETNRCRSLASTSSFLTPCEEGQERNPVTNRCRSSDSNSLQPCAANQERNPTTNRCRVSSSKSTADFPVESVAKAGQATLGWWAFGGVGTIAVGYAGWEWRREVGAVIRKISHVGIGRS